MQSNSKKVSIIIPLYNYEQYVEKAVRSLMNQTYSNIEIIVVDDGSIDKSGEIVDALAKEDERIKVVHQDNGGIGKAYKTGLGMVTGDYIAFLDSDDYMNLEAYEKLVSVAEETNADIVEFGITSYDVEGIYKGEEIPIEQEICGNENIIYDYFFVSRRPHLSTKFVKASLFIDFVFLPFSAAIDEMTTVELLLKTDRVVRVNESFYNVIRYKDSVSKSIIDGKKIKEQLLAYESMIQYLDKKSKKVCTYFAIDVAKKYSVMYYRNIEEGFAKQSDVEDVRNTIIKYFKQIYRYIDFDVAKGKYAKGDLLGLKVFYLSPALFIKIYSFFKR